MYFDEKGPLIFSASVHFAVIVFFMLKAMFQPEEKPEEMVFELYSPPSVSAPTPSTQVTYTPTEMDLPTLDEIDIPERPQIPDEPEPAPVEPPPEEPPPERESLSYADFVKANPIEKQRVPKPRPQTRRTTDLSANVEKLQQSLSNMDIALPAATFDAMSASDQSALENYFAQLRQAILSNVEIHPLMGAPLRTTVQFDLAPTGAISNVRMTTSSGDAEYDRKVVDGLKRLRQFGSPPGLTRTESLTFAVVQRDR